MVRDVGARTMLLVVMLAWSPVGQVGAQESRVAQGPDAATYAERFDATMQQFMAERSITAGALAVSWGGELRLSRGYGFADAGRTDAVRADDPFRLASVTKPITAAAIRRLVAAGRLRLDTPVFPLLGLEPLAGQALAARLEQITVQHLLEHRGGWDASATFDPMFCALEVAQAVHQPGPVVPEDIIRYMLGKPLQFDPGSREQYSNFGYCVLGRVIEKVSGRSYVEFVQADVLRPLGVSSVELGRSVPSQRHPREPRYLDPGLGVNVLQPQNSVPVAAPDGTFCLEAMDAHGGLIGSAPDLVRFLEAYWLNGEPRQGGARDGVFFGSLPGTWAMVLQRPNGVNVAVLFNQRTDPSGRDYAEIRPLMQSAADALSAGVGDAGGPAD